MRFLSIAIALMLMTSCINFRGDFTAYRELKLKHTTVFGNIKYINVPVGRYSAMVNFSSENKIKLTLQNDNEYIIAKLQLPNGHQFPRETGRVFLSARETGQSFDIEGYVNSKKTNSRVRRTSEFCSTVGWENECRNVCDGGSCRNICEDVPVNVDGTRDVEYRYEHVESDLKLNIMVPNGAHVAQYSGTDITTNKVYFHKGPCL